MTNVEYLKKYWFRNMFCCKKAIKLKKPWQINKFVEELMDPFKNTDDYHYMNNKK
jgi:hypothetical protein